jgi:hypothetical protein
MVQILLAYFFDWSFHKCSIFLIFFQHFGYYTIINLVRVWYDGLSPRERLWHKLSRGDNPSYHTLTRLIIVLLHQISYTESTLHNGLCPRLPGKQTFRSPPCCCCIPREVTGFINTWGSQGNFHGGFLACGWYNHAT